MNNRKIQTTVAKVPLKAPPSDALYWKQQSYVERIDALEEIRREYNSWKYTDAERRFQRVYRVVELKQR